MAHWSMNAETGQMIRRALPAEAESLTELAVRSKAHWGYDSAFLNACRDELRLTPEDIATSSVFVYEGGLGPSGYYRLLVQEQGSAELDALFVEPNAIGGGVGRRLWDHAVKEAAGLGCKWLFIQSDPFAEGFYRAMGATRVGESESGSESGRMLPVLRYLLPEASPR